MTDKELPKGLYNQILSNQQNNTTELKPFDYKEFDKTVQQVLKKAYDTKRHNRRSI